MGRLNAGPVFLTVTEQPMSKAVNAFLAGIIDYAGLFPPALLPLQQAMTNYLRYRSCAESWMLGRFICPAARLKELAAFRQDIVSSGKLRLAVLGRGGKDVAEFMGSLSLDLADISTFRESWSSNLAAMETYEVKLTPALF